MDSTLKSTYLGEKTEKFISKIQKEIVTCKPDKGLQRSIQRLEQTIESQYSISSNMLPVKMLNQLYFDLDECESKISEYYLNNKFNTFELFLDIFELKSILRTYTS